MKPRPKPRKTQKTTPEGLPGWLQLLLFLCSLGLWQYYLMCRAEKSRWENLRSLIPEIRLAIRALGDTQDMLFYFSAMKAQGLLQCYAVLLDSVPKDYKNCGLEAEEQALVGHFLWSFANLEQIRSDYNERFIPMEIGRYRDFFAGLDAHPRSEEQMRAVVCEEDNNLVIAGAGTGKTTTISAKIAYLLQKSLVEPEELLVISFTNNAVEEMAERTSRFLRDGELTSRITFKTFNGFGNMVTRYCSENPKKLAFDGKDYLTKAFLQRKFDELFLSDGDFALKAINFLAFFARPERDDFDFESADALFTQERSFRNKGLDGREYRSMEEVQIANFLYLHQVEYEYESLYPMEREDRNPEFGAYSPDFFLPGYGIYHEHYGIDEKGDVPSYFKYRPPFTSAREQYHHGMAWKADIHEKYQTTLIKTYSFQAREGQLLRVLKNHLLAHGVRLEKRPAGELLDTLKEAEDFEDFMGLIYTFLNLMKSNHSSLAELRSGRNDQRFSVFLDVFEPLLRVYQAELERTVSMDYNDMVNLSSGYIRSGDFRKKYKYILVDEFQDMSLGRYGLLKSLKSANPQARLYAVGDDWQSIFRFTGSDIGIMTEFSKHFGATALNGVLRTYRFNQEILNLSSGFIQKNPVQLKKTLSSPFQAAWTAFELVPVSVFGNSAIQSLQKFDALKRILGEISRNHGRATVFLIGRYRRTEPDDLRELQKAFKMLSISYFTAHSSKGLTCDVSVLLDLDGGVFGFPSAMADDPILSNLLHEGDSFEHAEERRLFYVALTRAKHQVYLMYNPQNPSVFLQEIISDYALGEKAGEQALCRSAMGCLWRGIRQGAHFWAAGIIPSATIPSS
ncbi:UvrD-helicase domain-containing protein [Pedobacter aquatilis]|nr:UvrD-helicase domain-containing protein [Pedobacter aquatilis]MDN3585655.1 UvrD-helicase domain-containing protein [Pedobacter aquatilis]